MIATALKYYLYDIGIGLFFDVVGSNFSTNAKQYVGGYWMAVDADDNTVVAYGKCIEQNGSLIVLDRGDGEYIVHTDLFHITAITRGDVSLIRLADDKEGSDDT